MTLSNYPPYLYHYTSIENLALILKSKKLRFNRADKVNDLEEVLINDLPDIKRKVFISCWTGTESESIPLWSLYASNNRGIRIKLRSNMFKGKNLPYKSFDNSSYIINLLSLENVIKLENNKYQWIPFLFGPAAVNYTDDSSVFILDDDEIKVYNIGTYKLDHWSFEKEYRYIVIPDALWDQENKKFVLNKNFLMTEIKNDYIDIPLDIYWIDNIEVMLGPGAREAEKIIVQSLLKQYTKHGILKESDLKYSIRK